MSFEETPAVHRDGKWVETKLRLITERAKRDPKCKFTTLAYLLNEGYLLECFKELKRGKAPGTDGVTVEEYEKNLTENIKGLVERLKGKRYRPQPVRRTYIPKDAKSLRPLGIPTIEDKLGTWKVQLYRFWIDRNIPPREFWRTIQSAFKFFFLLPANLDALLINVFQ